VPLIAQRATSGRPDAAMEPDKVVQPSVSDITTGVDSEMVAVRSLVRINLNAASADRLLRPLQNRQMYFYAGAHCPGKIDQRCEFLKSDRLTLFAPTGGPSTNLVRGGVACLAVCLAWTDPYRSIQAPAGRNG